MTTINNFTGAEGSGPQAALIDGGDGNFYGTTHDGGTSEAGTVFAINARWGADHPLHFPQRQPGSILVAVARDKLGQSTVSSAASIHSTVANHAAPLVSLGGITSGMHFKIGSTTAVSVDASESGALVSRQPAGPARAYATGSGELALLESYLNGTKLSQATKPPFNFTFTPPSAGKYVLHAVATDSSGLATVSAPVVVQADVPPTVNLALGGTGAAVEGGARGVIIVSRTGDTTLPLIVSYKTKGAAVAGVDYKKLPGVVTIPAGAAKAKIKVKPLAGLTGAGTLKLKLWLLPGTDDSYAVGTSPVKIKLIGE